jgi:hypothetical protein
MTGLTPSPCDVAVVHSILPALDQAGIDWAQPAQDWSKDVMVGFLMLAWRLIREAEIARDQGPGKVFRKSELLGETNNPTPFVP